MMQEDALSKLVRAADSRRPLGIAVAAAVCAAVAVADEHAVRPQEALMASLTLTDGDRATIETVREPDGRIKTVVRGDFYDGRRLIRAMLRTPWGSIPDADLDIKVAMLLGFNGETLRDLDLKLSERGGEIVAFSATATVGDNASLKGDLRRDGNDNRWMIYLESSDAGAFFRTIDVYERMWGGRMRLGVDTLASDHAPKDAVIDVRDFTLTDEFGLKPFVIPIDEPKHQEPDGLQFSRLRMELKIFTGRIEINDGFATGWRVAATAAGEIDFEKNEIDMRGVAVPLFSADPKEIRMPDPDPRRGVIGFGYRFVGPPQAANLQIDPAAPITPGLLRKLLQAPAGVDPH